MLSAVTAKGWYFVKIMGLVNFRKDQMLKCGQKFVNMQNISSFLRIYVRDNLCWRYIPRRITIIFVQISTYIRFFYLSVKIVYDRHWLVKRFFKRPLLLTKRIESFCHNRFWCVQCTLFDASLFSLLGENMPLTKTLFYF